MPIAKDPGSISFIYTETAACKSSIRGFHAHIHMQANTHTLNTNNEYAKGAMSSGTWAMSFLCVLITHHFLQKADSLEKSPR